MAKYIMSEKEEELEIDLEEVIEFFATEKTVGINENKYPLGFNSPLLNVPVISLYDDSLLMEKYPNGVVTENFVLIPFDKFKEIKESSIVRNEKKYSKGTVKIHTEKFKPLISNFMMAFVEMSLNVEMTHEEKLQIKKDIKIDLTPKEIEKYKKTSNYIEEIIPEKVTNRELLKVIEGKNYSFESKVRNPNDLSTEVKEILKINESYVENINSLKQKIQDVSIKEVDTNISVEEFKDLVDKSTKCLVSSVLPLKIVNKKINDVLNQTQPNIENFIEESKKQVFPYLVELPALQFKSSMELIFKEAFGGINNDGNRFGNLHSNENKIAFGLELFKDLDGVKRNYLITVITGFDAVTKSMIIEDNPQRRYRK